MERHLRTVLRPEGTTRKLLFPGTGLEFSKWNRVDTLGFLGACLFAFAQWGCFMWW